MKKSSNFSPLIVAAICCVFILIGLLALSMWRSGKLASIGTSIKSQLAAVIAADLSTAASFAVLAGSAITNTGSSVISGDIGSYPTATITGFPPGTISGTNHGGDATTQGAKTDLTAAYIDAAGQTPVSTIATELGGTTQTAGAYDSTAGTFAVTGTLTLDAQGDPNAVFIFKTASTLTTAGASTIVLVNGAQSCNVFWQVGSSATLGTYSTFKGNILALTSITLTTGANVEGSVLARNGAVTLDSNIINKVACGGVPPAVVFVAAATVGGTGTFAPLPLINVVKIPNPLALPSGPGSVTYTYTVTNIGVTPMQGVWVKDNKCDAVGFVSGDTDSDSLLDTNEAWLYRCSKMISQTETNTATAHGSANGWDGYDTANATVAVGVPLPPPLINLVKKPSVFVLPAGGGPVTYTYTVTNPGTAPLSDVSVIDDKCTGLPGRVVGHPGDLNKNDLLESNETWAFTCQTNLIQTTTNIGTAEGHANGLTAIDFSSATVLVSDQNVSDPMLLEGGFPNTGFPPAQTLTGGTSIQFIGSGVAEVRAGIPVRLKIPKINVDAPLDSVGMTAEGVADVPKDPAHAAWFNVSPRPGEGGVSVIDGHFGWKDGIPAVFDSLSTLHAGDRIYIEDEKGEITTFVVRELRVYGENDDASDMTDLQDGNAHLILITCEGTWNATTHSYSNRLVVFTDKE